VELRRDPRHRIDAGGALIASAAPAGALPLRRLREWLTGWSADQKVKLAELQPKGGRMHEFRKLEDVRRLEQRPARSIQRERLSGVWVEFDGTDQVETRSFQAKIDAACAAEE